MEPDIIRLYSSSPPPLDNGAEDDDDEFGEFGGFSEVNSSVGFADFDATDYSNSKEDFIPPNHFLPIHGYSDVNSISSTKTDKDCFAETSDSTLGQSEVLETITCNETIQSRTSNSPFDGRASPDNIRTKVQEKEHFVRQEHISPEVISPEVNVSNQEISNCNGEKVCSLEILTNGFAVLDSVNPQGIEYLDFDSDSKGLKTISTHSTAPSFESRPNPSGVFADVTTFSNTNTVQLEVMEQKACRELGDAEVPKSQDNHVINRVDERSTAKSVSYPGTCENEEQSELEPEQVGISEDSAALEGEDQLEQNPMSWDCETVVGSSTLPTSLKSERNWGSENVGGEEKGEAKNAARRTVSINASRTYGSTETINDSQRINEDELGQVQAVSSVPTKIVSLSEFEGVTNGDLGSENAAFPSTDKDDLGMVVSVMPPSTGETLESNGCKASETTSEQLPQFSESGGEFGDFGNLSTDSHPEFIAFESKKKQSWDALSDPCGADSKFPDFPVRPFAHVDEEDEGEFGDFDSMPKTRDGRDTFQDFDDFADFSSASCSQAGEWNAFEDEQKGSTWAAFGDEQAVDSFSNEEEPWQPHRTEVPVASDIDQSIKDSVWPTSHTTESTVYCQDSTAPPQTSLLGRLERIFQVCFPAIPVPEVEETIPTLKSLLEKGEKQGKEQAKSGDSSANSGQLLDVWMALQDIHDGYGLKYQWGGSHSNKKLLCSLGIDTRNILFTGNKKQPVIVPMYASGLGMLEPTKEPLKPVSAAEKITSIGQTPPVSPEIIPSDQFQESLPPVQFDWSSSGLTNPLDGVDPELYELTTSKLESSNTSSKVTDAFARLMSTVEKTSTSARKPKKEEHLSEEAVKVITSLPDLSFMHAKVLMFPATLTPSTSCQGKVD